MNKRRKSQPEAKKGGKRNTRAKDPYEFDEEDDDDNTGTYGRQKKGSARKPRQKQTRAKTARGKKKKKEDTKKEGTDDAEEDGEAHAEPTKGRKKRASRPKRGKTTDEQEAEQTKDQDERNHSSQKEPDDQAIEQADDNKKTATEPNAGDKEEGSQSNVAQSTDGGSITREGDRDVESKGKVQDEAPSTEGESKSGTTTDDIVHNKSQEALKEPETREEQPSSDAPDVLSSEQLHKMKVTELRDLLKRLSLPRTGNKSVLIKRYIEAKGTPTPNPVVHDAEPASITNDSTVVDTDTSAMKNVRQSDESEAKEGHSPSQKPEDDSVIPAQDDEAEKKEDAAEEVSSATHDEGSPVFETREPSEESATVVNGTSAEAQPEEVEEVILVPSSLPPREQSDDVSMEDSAGMEVQAVANSEDKTHTQAETTANAQSEGKEQERRRQRKAKYREEMERLYQQRIETERKLKQLTQRETRLKRRDAARRERIKAKKEGRPVSTEDATKGDPESESSTEDSFDHALSTDEDDDEDWSYESKGKAKRKTPTPIRKGGKDEAVQKHKKGTLLPRSLTEISGNTDSTALEDKSASTTAQSTESNKDEDSVDSSLDTTKSLPTPEIRPRKRRRKESVSAPPEQDKKANDEMTNQLEQLNRKEDLLTQRLLELDEERKRIMTELDALRAERDALDNRARTTSENQKKVDENITENTPTSMKDKTTKRRRSAKRKDKTAEDDESAPKKSTAKRKRGVEPTTPTKSPRATKSKKSRHETPQKETLAEPAAEEPAVAGAALQESKSANDHAEVVTAEEQPAVIRQDGDDDTVDILGDGEEKQEDPTAAMTQELVPIENRPRFKWRAGFVSNIGGRPENQDAYIVPASALASQATTSRSRGRGRRASAPIEPEATNSRDELAIFAVLDGHGLKGQFAAQVGAKHLQTYIEECYSDLRKDDIAEGGNADVVELVKRAIKVGIEQTQDMLLKDGEESGIEYGTTAVVCVQVENYLVIGNVGDSRAVLFRCPRSTTPTAVDLENINSTGRGRGRGRGSRGTRGRGRARRATLELANPQLKEVLISQDHRPWRKEEAERVARESKGRGRVALGTDGKTWRVLPSLEHFTIEEIRSKRLGLAMTRSLGHTILSTCGVSSEPDFFSATLQDGDKLIIGCDGLWDVLSNAEAMQIVSLYAGQDPQTACKALVQEAERRWEHSSSGGDNITAVVVFFNSV